MKPYDWMLLFKRVCMVFSGLFVLVLGIVWIVAASYSLVRYVLGPMVAMVALYVIWHALFGSKSDAEDL